MSSAAMKLPKAFEEKKDPLAIDGDIRIKNEVDEVDNLEASIRKKKNGVQILSFAKNAQSRKEDLGYNSKSIEIKREAPCNCMQNIEYFCYKCNKTLFHINEVKHCSECNNQLKLRCRSCHRRYKLLRSINPLSNLSISTNLQKEIDIKEEQHFSCFKCSFKTTERNLLDDHIIENNHQPDKSSANYSSKLSKSENKDVLFCYKCEFSTKDKENLNLHILKSHWQPEFDVKINCDDDMYIELLCKNCQKICRKVVYDNMVKLVCRECQIPMLYRCTLCRTGYKLLKNVRYHVKCVCPYRTNNEKFYCADCTFNAATKARLESHIVKKHLKQECVNCDKVFEDNDALKEHVLEHCTVKKGKVRPIELELPIKEPTDEDEAFVIVRHNPNNIVKAVTAKPPKDTKEWGNLIDYLCLECGGEAKKKFARYRPWCRKCNLKYDYRCMSCDKLYGNYDRIQYHVQFRCPNRMGYECPLCSYNVPKKSLLLSHVQTTHTVYKCMECFTNVEGSLATRKHQTTNCSKDRPLTTEQLEKLLSLYCKKCCKKSRKAANTPTATCRKCTTVLSYQCSKCFNIIDGQNSAYKHVKELCKPNFCCDKCTFKTYTQKGLDVHTRYKHASQMCPDCGVNFKDEVIFQLHRREEIRRKKEKGMTPIPPPKRFKAS